MNLSRKYIMDMFEVHISGRSNPRYYLFNPISAEDKIYAEKILNTTWEKYISLAIECGGEITPSEILHFELLENCEIFRYRLVELVWSK